LVASAAHDGFLSGLSTILVIGGLVAVGGAAIALRVGREGEVERERPERITLSTAEPDVVAA
jgi:hypothetical protein